ncbi:sodium:solute symporter family transporter [Siminovitchia sp. 179-K 8D1 HS]|uniref:sodium:solute symporter family transporter n=1 Tax=Siminovitchia sp. 179-K 8D1 HS TaxID=3142385 RepID=UPI0039A27C08
MSTTIIIIVAIYLLICILIGLWATRRTKTASDFLIAGRNLGMFVMAIAAFSSIQSGFGMLGGTGLTFSNGMGFVAGIGISASLGFALTWYLAGKRIWQIGSLGEVYTLGDVVEKRYESKAVRGWLGLAIAFGVIGYLGTQVQAMGVIMQSIFGISPKLGAIIGLGILAFYCVGGGIIASVYTDLFQGVIMVVVSLIVFFLAINAGGGVQTISENLQSADPLLTSSFGTYPIITVVCWIFLFSLGAAGQPHFINKFLMIKSQKELKWGAFTAGLAYAFTTLLVIGIGLTARSLEIQGKFPEIASPDESLTTFVTHFTSPIVAGLVLSGLLAAIMSTGSAFVTLGAASLIRDIPRAFNKQVKNELLFNRLAVVGLLILSLLFSFYMDTLVALLGIFGWGTFASAVFPPIVLGLIWKKATKYGAIASIIVGLILNFTLEILNKYEVSLLPPGVIVGAFAFIVSIIVFIGVSLLTQESVVKLDKDVVDAMEG